MYGIFHTSLAGWGSWRVIFTKKKLQDALQGRRVVIFLLVSHIFLQQSLSSLQEVTDKHFMKSLTKGCTSKNVAN
jgi:hypothetical protein